MISVLLTIAALFWGVSADTPVTVDWNTSRCEGGNLAIGCSGLNSHAIHLSAPQWATMSGTERCAIIVHEYGHAVMGLDHSEDPGSVMYGGGVAIPATCHRYNHPPAKGIPLTQAQARTRTAAAPRASRLCRRSRHPGPWRDRCGTP